MPQIVDKNKLMIQTNEKRHEIRVDPDDPDMVMEIWVRDMTFFDVQRAAQKMFIVEGGNISFDLGAYWKYAFENFITRTNPKLSPDEMLSLSAYIGEQISLHLPKPTELAEAIQGDFTKANR
mgnify:CR=1 FL=1